MEVNGGAGGGPWSQKVRRVGEGQSWNQKTREVVEAKVSEEEKEKEEEEEEDDEWVDSDGVEDEIEEPYWFGAPFNEEKDRGSRYRECRICTASYIVGNCGVWEGFCYPCMEIKRKEKAMVWYKVDRKRGEGEGGGGGGEGEGVG